MSDISFKIDGKLCSAAPGQTLLDVAEKNGIKIPTLCGNPKISKTTSCFVCLVKDCKTGKFLPSCAARPSEGQEIEASSPEVLDMRKTALELLLSEHAGDCEAPCTISCPAHASVEEYVRAGRNGDFLEALKIIKKRIPLPMSIGRVCPRFCEKDCRKNVSSKPVAINEFKRLAADLHYESYVEDVPALNGKKIAVVGAGPAGLAAAYYLRLEGFEPVVFEKMPEAGGMLRYGIPEFRLPKKTLAKELAHFAKLGIKINCGIAIGKDITLDELKKSYSAVIVTIGCWSSSSMRVKGEELAADGIKWLEKVASANWQGLKNPGTTIVIGGGNTAMDCLRTAVRMGSKDVSCVYRRTEKEMPAEAIEIHEAKEEGVNFRFLTAPVSLKKSENGRLVLTCQKMELGAPDASGRRSPVPVAGSDFDIEADTVIAAIGQKVLPLEGIPLNKWGNVEVASETLKCNADGLLFAAGDCQSGCATVVEAVAGGRKAALAAIDYIEGREHKQPRLINVSRGHWSSLSKEDLVYINKPSEDARIEAELIPMDKRTGSFDELFPTFSKEEVMKEGKRCIECSCTAKSDCKLKSYSEEYGANPVALKGERNSKAGYDARHPHIVHDRMKCIKCGVCVKVCSEVVNKNLLSQKNRGFHTTVETAFRTVLPLSCTECGACIGECPVGALDWKNKKN